MISDNNLKTAHLLLNSAVEFRSLQFRCRGRQRYLTKRTERVLFSSEGASVVVSSTTHHSFISV